MSFGVLKVNSWRLISICFGLRKWDGNTNFKLVQTFAMISPLPPLSLPRKFLKQDIRTV
uniref:Uncharacterized protein n=1 Tax=Anguilla anguilla TaxID=7936 RepID=A0A0E9VU27_ANGAN